MSVWITLHRCGFGYSPGLFPELRCGLLSIGWCRGAIAERLRTAAASLRSALWPGWDG
jgi:hypothetical protein